MIKKGRPIDDNVFVEIAINDTTISLKTIEIINGKHIYKI